METESLESLYERPVAIFGAGVTGRAAAAFLARRGVDTVFYDEQPQLSGDSVNDFPAAPMHLHGLAVVSPGFRRDHPWLVAARERNVVCLGELDLAALSWPGRILTVTGTNGKSTTTRLIEEALKAADRPAVACGNIGHPLTAAVDDAEPGTWAVCEVSSFQAEILSRLAADAVIWTNLDEDHLDRHGDLAGYYRAKARLFECRRAPDTPCWVGATVVDVARHLGEILPTSARRISPEPEPENLDGVHADSPFREPPQSENYALVHAFWRHFDFPPEALVSAANRFTQLPHRLERVADLDGLRFWDDSKATNFGAALAALQRFDQPVYWIAGGRAKGGDPARFVARARARVDTAYLIGESAQALAAACAEAGIAHVVTHRLEAAVDRAVRDARRPGDIVFSPGFASFDQYANYAARGEHFQTLVDKIQNSDATSIA